MYVVHTAWQHISGTIGERSVGVIIDCSGGSISVNPGPAPGNVAGWYVFIAELDSPSARQNQIATRAGSRIGRKAQFYGATLPAPK